VWRPVMVGLPYDTGKRRNSDSTGKEHGRFSGILCSVKEPIAESIFTTVPSGIFFSERLNAVSRMRVANISWSSNGALAMEKVRTFPSASVSGGFGNVRSADCPGLKSNPVGFSKWKAIVPSATSTLFNSLDAYADTGISSAAIMAYGWYPSFCH
jgi:hypothetical protein